MKLLIIAGGTGGHIFPALVVAQTLKKQDVLIEWLGTEVGMEKKLVGDQFPIYFLPVKAFRGKSFLTKIFAPLRLLRVVFLAYHIIKKINPDVVLGMGGYASGPSGIAAWLLRKPLVIHEQNAKAGLTNRVLARFATKILQAFPHAFSKNISAVTVGNPVRLNIQQMTKNYDARKKPWHILILGGSQGAAAINQLIVNWISQTQDRDAFLIWHQTGQKDFESTKKNYANYASSIYRITAFIETIEEAYDWADIVICRAGALTVSELAAAGLPSILIPYPYAADDHQYSNALFLKNANAGVLFRESEINTEKLGQALKDLISSLPIISKNAKQCAQYDAELKIIAALMKLSV